MLMAQPIVAVQEGQLLGKIVNNHNGGQYFSFQGIPYAKPPIGELRFKAPQPAEPWTGVRDATKEGSECYSRHMILEHIIGSEDCLFLNVYTPDLPSQISSLKPVMVWVHGGGFTCGSGNAEAYGPEFLLAEDVVVVTFNYRLGLLGFLNMEDPSLGVPGNAGLKDQVLALKWVQNNIDKFNGDANNVTIFGESAGAASVHYLMLSPMTKGLFHRAIAQSGCALGCWTRGQRSAPIVASTLGLTTKDEHEILKLLKEMPVEKVLELQEKIPDPFIPSEVRPYGAVIETSTAEPAFLAQEPLDIIAQGKYNKVPLMIGFNSREGMLSEIISKSKYGKLKLVTDFEKSIPCTLNIPHGGEMSKKIAHEIKTFFYGEEEPSMENIDQYYLLQTDNYFLRPINTTVKQHASTSSEPIYYYRVSLESILNIYKRMCQITHPGVCHGDELGYIFKTAITPYIRPRSIEEIGVRRFAKLWANFARNGNPNPTKKDSLITVFWKPVEQDKLHFLDIGENLTVGVNPEADRMAFWDEIYSLSNSASKLLSYNQG